MAVPRIDEVDAAGTSALQTQRVAYAPSMHRCNDSALRLVELTLQLFNIVHFTGKQDSNLQKYFDRIG